MSVDEYPYVIDELALNTLYLNDHETKELD